MNGYKYYYLKLMTRFWWAGNEHEGKRIVVMIVEIHPSPKIYNSICMKSSITAMTLSANDKGRKE